MVYAVTSATTRTISALLSSPAPTGAAASRSRQNKATSSPSPELMSRFPTGQYVCQRNSPADHVQPALAAPDERNQQVCANERDLWRQRTNYFLSDDILIKSQSNDVPDTSSVLSVRRRREPRAPAGERASSARSEVSGGEVANGRLINSPSSKRATAGPGSSAPVIGPTDVSVDGHVTTTSLEQVFAAQT